MATLSAPLGLQPTTTAEAICMCEICSGIRWNQELREQTKGSRLVAGSMNVTDTGKESANTLAKNTTLVRIGSVLSSDATKEEPNAKSRPFYHDIRA